MITRPLELEPELDFHEAELGVAAAAGVCGGVVCCRLLEAAATNEGGKYC